MRLWWTICVGGYGDWRVCVPVGLLSLVGTALIAVAVRRSVEVPRPCRVERITWVLIALTTVAGLFSEGIVSRIYDSIGQLISLESVGYPLGSVGWSASFTALLAGFSVGLWMSGRLTSRQLAVICVVPLVAIPVCDVWALSPVGTAVPLRIRDLFSAVSCTVLFALPCLAIAALASCRSGVWRKRVLVLLAATALLGLAIKVGERCLGEGVRVFYFRAVPVRAEPLIAAIRAYTHDTGTPPDQLEKLVPNYLDRIPGTGLGVYPDFCYFPPDIRSADWGLLIPVMTGKHQSACLACFSSRKILGVLGDQPFRRQFGPWAYYSD